MRSSVRGCVRWLLVVLLMVAAGSAAQKQYTNKYDNVNVEQILANGRVLSNYIRCMMDEGPCTAEGRELKRTLPDALLSGCEKCNDKQRQTSEKVIRHLIKNRPRDWDRLVDKYDPQKTYRQRYEKLL